MAYWNARCRVCKTEQPGSFHPGENRWQNCDRYALFLVTQSVKLGEELGVPLSSVSTPSAPDWLLTNYTRAYLSVPVTHKKKILHGVSLVYRALCTC